MTVRSIPMRLVVAFSLFLAPVAGSPAYAQAKLRIAAVVNEEAISAYDLNSRISLAIATSGVPDSAETRRRIAPQVLRNLIDERVKMQEAKRLNLQVGRQDINAALGRIEKQNNLAPGGLDAFLARQGIVKVILIEQIEAAIAWSLVVKRKLGATNQVGEDEIDEALAKIEANKGKPEHLVAEIFIPVDSAEQEPQALGVINRLIEQLRAKANFAALARSFSQSASAAVGGDLGWVQRGQLGQELDAVIDRLKAGQISKPVRTVSGYHILMLRDRRAAPGLDDANDISVTLSQLVLPVAPNAPTATVEDQARKARALSAKARNCKDMSVLAKETKSPLSGTLGTHKLERLPAEFRDVVRSLAVGTPGPALRTDNGIVILMVCNREEIKSEITPRQRVESMLNDQRLDNAARRFLRDLRRAAFIDIRL